MAARDRFGAFPHVPQPSELQGLIQRACDPGNYEPNLALNFQIADLINTKKGNAPREAAVAIVNYINHRNPNVSLLALSLLDICVKNCGYPFHLQISTKDFLNELVRRFPERPPARPSRVQQRILQAIEEWRGTICQTSKYKDDLGFIRDMHRLLQYKGYQFPHVRREDAAVLNPEDSLKSAEEMEEEERAAQQAKLQELIRRGTPQDLQEANHLMKILAGYDQHKPDYRAKAAEEIQKFRQRAKLLEEMLDSVEKGDKVGDQDIFEDLAISLKKAQPKIQRIIEEESDDAEAVVKMLELNDHINVALERYNLIKKGDIAAAKKIPKPAPADGTPAKTTPAKEVSLIDLDFDAGGSSGGTTAPAHTGLEDDLLGLSFSESSQSTFGQGGGIALGFGANTGVPGPPLLSSTLQANTAQSSSAGPSQVRATPSPAPNYNITISPTAPSTFSGISSSSTPQYTSPPQPKAQPILQQVPQPTPPVQTQTADDDEWNFVAALPGSQGISVPSEFILHSSQVQITLSPSRNDPAGPIVIQAKFSNNTTQLIHDLTFSIAVPKVYSFRMDPQSGRSLQPNQHNGIHQQMHIFGVPQGQGRNVKMRWKVSYKVGITGGLVEQQGVVDSLPVA